MQIKGEWLSHVHPFDWNNMVTTNLSDDDDGNDDTDTICSKTCLTNH